MIYRLEQIVADVRALLNLNVSRNGPLGCGDIETLTLDRRIATLLPGAVARVELESPAASLGGSPSFAGEALQRLGDTMVYSVDLPADYLRLVSFRLSSWQTEVSDPVTTASLHWQLLSSPEGAVLSGDRFPVAALRHSPGGQQLLAVGAAVDSIAVATYRRQPRLTDEQTIEIAEALYPTVLTYITTSLQ